MIVIRRWDTERLCVVLPYDLKMMDQIRRIEDRKWHPVEKVWSFPDTEKSVQQLAAIIKHHAFRLHPALKHPWLEKELATIIQHDHNEEIKHQRLSRLMEQLKLKGYSIRTQKAYMGHAERFENFVNQPIESIQKQHIHHFLCVAEATFRITCQDPKKKKNCRIFYHKQKSSNSYIRFKT